MSERFPSQRRLRKRREFLAVQEGGRKTRTRSFVVLCSPRQMPDCPGRLGITVSKRVGSAVVRNRIKRLVREFVRKNPDWLPAGRDVVVIGRRAAADLPGLAQVAAELGAIEGRLR